MLVLVPSLLCFSVTSSTCLFSVTRCLFEHGQHVRASCYHVGTDNDSVQSVAVFWDQYAFVGSLVCKLIYT